MSKRIALIATVVLAAASLAVSAATAASKQPTVKHSSHLLVGINGDAPEPLIASLRGRLARLPAGAPALRASVPAARPRGIEVEIVEKDTRATAISLSSFPTS